VIEIGERLVYWTAPHPSWRPGADWPREVGCVLYRHPDALVLMIDSLVDDWAWLEGEVASAELPVVVLLTAPWYRRDAPAVAQRFGASIWAAETGGEPIAGIRAMTPCGVDEGQVALSLEPERALVVAEIFLGKAGELEVCPSPATTDMRAFAAWLQKLETLPIERVLPGHGPPVLTDGGAAIAAALRRFGV
jgi:hypothetical protein